MMRRFVFCLGGMFFVFGMAGNIYGNARQDYCDFSQKTPEQFDYDNYGDVIARYSPILYLHEEDRCLPISVENYFTGPYTQLIDKETGAVKYGGWGKITMEDLYSEYKKNPDNDLFFEIRPCVERGLDPALNTKNNALVTPAYVIDYVADGKMYIQYMLFYALNGPYQQRFIHKILHVLYWMHFAKSYAEMKEELNKLFNRHEADLEHITLVVDEKTKKLEKIYYGSHGRDEGMWLSADHEDVSYEGSHPVIYVARSGHGNYPKQGTYVRIYGIANDVTSEGRRWDPQWVRVFSDKDERFDPRKMAWLYHSGNYGSHGVSAAFRQAWFLNSTQGDVGREYETIPFCGSGNVGIYGALMRWWCLLCKSISAYPPA